MGPLIAAWMVAEGIIIYRSAKLHKAPPGPGQLLFSSGVFVMLGILAEVPKARGLAATLGWGFVIAAWMHLFDDINSLSPKDDSPTWPPKPVGDDIIIPDGT